MGEDVSTLVRAAAAHGLPGPHLEPPETPVSDALWPMFLARVNHQRTAGLAASAAADGAWPVSDAQAKGLFELHRSALVTCVLLERELLTTVELLRGADIDYRVLKGAAHGHTIYPDPAMRCFGDIDLIVPGRSFEAAVALLEAAGGERRFPEPRPGFDRRFSKGASFKMPGGHEVDLHRTFVAGPFGLTVDLDGLFTTAATFTVGGVELLGLAPEERFLHACFHAALGNGDPRVGALRDVAQIAAVSGVDHDRVLRLARTWQCEVVVAHAVTSTWKAFGLTVDNELTRWSAGYQPTAAALRNLNLYLGSRRSYAGQAIGALRAIRGVRDKVAYLHAITLPRRAIHARGSRWRIGVRTVLRGKGPT